MFLIKLYICVGFFYASKAQSIFRPNLPLGEYRLKFHAIRQCETAKDLPIKVNLYLNKMSTTITELKGSVTMGIPGDDSLSVDGNVASWSLTGGWKPNSILFVTNNACSKVKLFVGKVWLSFFKAFNISSVNCPIAAGTYVTSGYDTALLEDNNFPKVYFYGKYKFVGKVKNKNNELVGCVAYEAELVRPWEY